MVGVFCFLSRAQTVSNLPLIEVRETDSDELQQTEFSGNQVELRDPSSSEFLVNALKFSPGVQTTTLGSSGQPSSVTLRGGRSQDSLVLLDGFILNDPLSPSGAFDFSGFPAAEIQSTQIFLGPQSVRFGSGASAGAINVKIKSSPSTPRAQLTAGSASTLGVEASAGILNVSHFQTEGASAAEALDMNSNARLEPDGFSQQSVLLRTKGSPSDNLNLSFLSRWLRSRADLDNFGGASGDDPDSTTESQQGLWLIQGDFAQKFRAHLGHQTSRRQNSNPISNSLDQSYFGDFQSASTNLQLEGDWGLNDLGAITVGLQMRKEQGSSKSEADGIATEFQSRQFDSQDAYVLFKKDLRTSVLNAGARKSKTGQGLMAEAFEIQLDVALNEEVTLTLARSTGFKYASLFQRYSSYGKEDLRTERASQWSLGFAGAGTNPAWALSFYEQIYSDLIDFDLVSNKFNNISQVTARGADFAIGMKTDHNIDFEMGGSWIESRDSAFNLASLRKPKYSSFVKGTFQQADWSHSLSGRWTGSREDNNINGAGRLTLPEYFVADWTTHYAWSERSRLSFDLRNFLNRRYQEVAGYSSPAFNILARLECSL